MASVNNTTGQPWDPATGAEPANSDEALEPCESCKEPMTDADYGDHLCVLCGCCPSVCQGCPELCPGCHEDRGQPLGAFCRDCMEGSESESRWERDNGR